ncbi:MAG: TIM barrel protein [Candidatus Limnocylindrales bacterium]
MRFDVNLSILFTDLPLLRRPAAAAAAGFRAAELWWPFDDPVPSPSEVDRLIDAVGSAGLTLACLNFDGGDFSAGQRGLLADRAQYSRLADNIPVALSIAAALGCRVLNALYGNVERTAARDAAAVEALVAAGTAAAGIGASVVLEALNAAEFPEYGLHTPDAASSLAGRAREVAGCDVGILLDVYHVERSGSDGVAALVRHAPSIRHVQIADVPGRRRPGTGVVDFGRLFAALDRVAYDGFVGLEYLPSPDLGDTFAWLPLAERGRR